MLSGLVGLPNGIFLTHAHMGHYTGLMHLGREALGADGMPVFTMPRMNSFLSGNGPWQQLISLNNIKTIALKNDSSIHLTKHLKITPLLVPHRDEYSETVGYRIEGPRKSMLYIPDIDKWQKWDRDIKAEIERVDYALLDGTFYKNGEIPNRDMSLIPHPFIEESISVFEVLPQIEKEKIYFIHLNHTNPLLNAKSEAYKLFCKSSYNRATEKQIFAL